MYRVAVAGSSKYSLLFAKTLFEKRSFTIPWVLTPSPKPKGRNKELVNNPLHAWALKKNIPVILINKSIDDQVKKEIKKNAEIDFFLVVDFGYLIPSCLLKQPNFTALNIHPSALPKYRGSSPGQMIILNAEEKSAISLIKLNEKMDQGPIIAQIPFYVKKNWTQKDYYDNSFYLMADHLVKFINKYAKKQLKETAQTKKSPTPIARKLSKQDAFISWNLIKNLITDYTASEDGSTIIYEDLGMLMKLVSNKKEAEIAEIVCRASRAFYPWPIVWTIVQTKKGSKRMKIMPCKIKNDRIELQLVQIEGKNEAMWNEMKNSIDL